TPIGGSTAPAPPPTNRAPVVNAGPDQTITLPSSANLSGTATDDALPIGSTLTTTWSKVSGPGTVTFGNVSARSTTASFSASGSYVHRLTASDSALTATDDVAIVVNPAGSAFPPSGLLAPYPFHERSGSVTSSSYGATATLNSAT